MEAKLAFRWDREADILYIYQCKPYAEQESRELGDDVVARLNPESGEIEALEVLFFSNRFSGQAHEVPIIGHLMPAVAC